MPETPQHFEGIANIELEDEKHKDIVFFDSPYHTDQELAYSLIKDSGQNMDLPRGMLSIASSLKEAGVSSEVVPMDAYLNSHKDELTTDGEFDHSKFMAEIEGIIDNRVTETDPNILAFGLMYTFTEPTVLEMTKYAKAKYPDKKVIVGGNHATFSDLDLLDPERNSGIDIVVRYEGETTTRELAEELKKPDPDLSKIAGISYVDQNGEVHQNPPRNREDLYQMPPLDYSLINSPESLDKFNQTAMFMRGCRGNCAFCTSPMYWHRELKESAPANFEQELEYLAQNQVEIIGILDDDILASPESFELIIEALGEVHAKYPETKFFAQTRVTHLKDKEAALPKLERMREVGITRLYLGIESGSQDILNEMSKGYKTEWVEEALRNTKDADIETGGFWLFGHPGATAEREEESLEFMERLLKDNLLDEVEAHGVVPFPGTKIASDDRIQVFDHDKKHYGFLNNFPVYNLIDPKTGQMILSADQIKGYLDRSDDLRKKYLGTETAMGQQTE